MELTMGLIENKLREILDEYLGLASVELANKWVNGEVVLAPGSPGVQEKRIPIEDFFKKIISVRERLRLIEQKINNHPKLDHADKVELQQYVTKCYGSLTTFNVLFADPDDRFVGEKSKTEGA